MARRVIALPLRLRNNARTCRRWIAFGVVATLSAACGSTTSGTSSASGASPAGAGSTYTIHAILSLTGGASFLGQKEQQALQVLESQVNAGGGVQGHPIHFDIADNQSSPSVSVALAAPLIKKNIPILLNGSVVAVDAPVDKLVGPSGPVIYDLSPGVHPKHGGYVFSSSPSTASQTAAFANYAKAKGWTRLAAITSTDGSGQDGWKNIQAAVAKVGRLQIVDHETFAPNDVSASTQVTKVASSKPQAIFVWSTGTPVGIPFRAMTQAGLTNIPVLTTPGNESYAEMAKLASVLPKQLYFASSRFRGGPAGLSGQAATVTRNFFDAFSSKGQKAEEGHALSWDPAQLFIAALKTKGIGASATQIRDYILGLSNYEGVDGTYDFTKPQASNRGLFLNAIRITKWNAQTSAWTPVSGPGGTPALG